MSANNVAKIEDRIDRAAAGALTIKAGLNFQNMAEVMEFSKMMAVSDMSVPQHLRGNAGACLAIVTQAVEWGLSPFAVAKKSYFVNGVVAFEAQLLQAVIIKNAPIVGRVRFSYSGEGQARKCIATVTTRPEGSYMGEELSIETPCVKDIKVKNSPLWVSDPDQQLSYYAGRALARRYFPDVLLGAYAADEVMDVTPPDKGEQIAARLSGEKAAPGFNAAAVEAEVAKPEAPEPKYSLWHDKANRMVHRVDNADAVSSSWERISESEASDLVQKYTREEAPKPAPTTFQVDPEMSRAGASAAIDGDPRTPPDGLSESERKSWLTGYDAVAQDDPGKF